MKRLVAILFASSFVALIAPRSAFATGAQLERGSPPVQAMRERYNVDHTRGCDVRHERTERAERPNDGAGQQYRAAPMPQQAGR